MCMLRAGSGRSSRRDGAIYGFHALRKRPSSINGRVIRRFFMIRKLDTISVADPEGVH